MNKSVESQPAPRPVAQIVTGCLIIPLLLIVAFVFVLYYVSSTASATLIVPEKELLLVRNAPDDSAPLLARFGEGRTINVTGRTKDWRWLEVEIWDGQRGWALRPLHILVWRIDASEKTPLPPTSSPSPVTPVEEVMIPIPATTFTMGSPPGLGQEDENPAHIVTLSAFEIDQTEVTVGQYWQCVEAGACVAPTSDDSQTEPHYLNDPAFDNHPVIHIPWLDAAHYCRWRGKRQPTEAEWEVAAGWNAELGAKSLWPWGNSDAAENKANIGDNSLGKIAAVGSFPDDKSPSGVLDMGGNVREWVLDWYKVDYYRVADDTNPRGPTYRRGEGSGRSVRGGSFADSIEQARTANRGHENGEYGHPTVGFRCARDQ